MPNGVKNSSRTGQVSSAASNSTVSGQSSTVVRSQILKGLSSEEALELYESELTPFEKTEIVAYSLVYTIGSARVTDK